VARGWVEHLVRHGPGEVGGEAQSLTPHVLGCRRSVVARGELGLAVAASRGRRRLDGDRPVPRKSTK
jgi:hypothetical protein